MPVRPDITPRLMPAPIAAAYIGVSESTLRQLSLPRRELLSKRMYDRIDLDQFVNDLPYEGQAMEVSTCAGVFGASSK